MADTEKSEQPQTNGLENGLDEDERNKMRPADIDADVREMERRKRVEMIMSSKLFREELERIIELQLKDGNGPAGLLQQISDMMGIQSGKLHTAHMFRGSNCVTPINDIRGVESMGYEKGEKNLRCKLASVFRLMDLYGWSQGINNQITARLNQDEEHFLVNPHGMLFNEITASSLVKVDMQGNIVEPGTTNFSVNTQGFLLHSAIHASRPDVNCVIHIKTPSVLAVSSLKCGLLPICQEALVIGEVSQHPFVSGIFEPEEREKIIRNLGPHNKVLLLHNHGAVCCGATIEEAFYNVYNTVLACETQMKLMPIGVENLLLVSDETRKQVYDAAHRAPDVSNSGDKKKFRVGEMEFEALIRMLDNAGFRTGYIYRHPLVKGELPKPKNDVEVPPAVSSLGYLIEQEELYKQGNWKKYIDGRNRLDRTKWLNSPNVYQKVEILETGTSDPKKITKWVDQNSEEWVAESSPTHSSTPVKIESALQFVPKGTNPKEFKKLQQQIKENRRADKITSGPQSHILEGVSWEEAKKLQDANITQTGDQVILVGAASKGIIQRNYQHNALVYKTPYAKNPFDSMSDKEIEDYKQLVERKQRGDTDYEESQSESEAISSSRQDGLRHFKSPLLSPQSATSETEEESRDEPRVLRIETKTAPRPIQAEVVLSDAESDTTDARVERSHSARYPKADKPESVTLMNSFRKSWSLKREKDKTKDVDFYNSRNLHPSLILNECEQDRMESLHCCVARVKQLTHKPVIVDVYTKALRPLLKSASDPCNLSTLTSDEVLTEGDYRQVPKEANTSLSCGNIVHMSELQKRLNVRKKLLHSAKMKFLGYHKTVSEQENEGKDKTPTSPMCALISEIRETISEIMSPERSVTREDPEEGDYFNSMRWIERPKFVSQSSDSELNSGKLEDVKSKVCLSRSFNSLNSGDAQFGSSSETFSDFRNDFQVLKLDLENSERSDTSNCNCAIHGRNISEKIHDVIPKQKLDENQNEEKATENVVTEIVRFVNASVEEATYTVTDDSLLQTYSFTESTETEWYYNKTIMKLENSQTMLEIKEAENRDENLELPTAKYIDTGIDTDFTSDKENESKIEERQIVEQKEGEHGEIMDDLDGDQPVGESSGLNKSSETDSSFLKSGSGRTSNDVDTSFAFKTETENSDKSPEKSSSNMNPNKEKKKFLEEMLLKTKKPIEEESSDSGETNLNQILEESPHLEKQTESHDRKLSDIPESPEFTNIDTEDAPVTSSSKDTSPEVAGVPGRPTEDEPSNATKEQEMDFEVEKENKKPGHKRKKNLKSSTKITVKKELKEKDSNEPVVSEIRLTIENLSVKCQSEKYEVKIQDVTNTSEDLSRSMSSADSFVQNVDSYESFEIVDKSCDCDAQQNLEELQGEVSSTIEKLHTIEDYFEDEIKKHSSTDSEEKGDERTIECNYREFEEVLNESRGQMSNWEKDSCNEDICKTAQINKNTEFFISSVLGDIRGEIQVCNNPEEIEVFTNACQEYETEDTPSGAPLLSVEKEMEDIAMRSAFVAAILSEAVLEENMKEPQEFVTGETTNGSLIEPGEIMEVICNIQKLPESVAPEINNENVKEVEKEMVEIFAEIIDGLKFEETTVEHTTETLEIEKSREENVENELEHEGPNGQPSEENHIGDKTAEKSEQVVEDQVYQDDQLSSIVVTYEVEEGGRIELDVGGLEILCGQECEGFVGVQTVEQPKEGWENVQNYEKQADCTEVIYQVLDFSPETSEGSNKSAGSQLEEVNDCIFLEETCIGEVDLSEGKSQEQFYQQRLDGSKEHVWQQPAVEIEYNSQEIYILDGDLQTESEQIFKQETKEESNSQEMYIEEVGLSAESGQGVQCYQEPVGEIDIKKDLCPQPAVEIELDSQEIYIVDDSLQAESQREEKEKSNSEEACIGEDGLAAESGQKVHEYYQEPSGENDCNNERVWEQPALDTKFNSHEIYVLDGSLQGESEQRTQEEMSEEYSCGPQLAEENDDVNILKREIHISEILRILYPTPMKAITYEPRTPQETFSEDKSDSGTVEYILNCLVNSVTEKSRRKLSSMNDVINFIVTNEESPTDSLAEFEDIENVISVSSSVVADIIDSIESQVEGDVESQPEGEDLKDVDDEKTVKKRRRKDDSMFKVTIATPTKKEIFINYSLDRSSTFNTSTDFEQAAGGDLCNSYIKTDDVNDDFENLSSDNPDFYSVPSSGKNSLNNSFCSAEGHVIAEQFCCAGCYDGPSKSPRSLAIIQEVDEGDSSTSSEAAAPSNPD